MLWKCSKHCEYGAGGGGGEGAVGVGGEELFTLKMDG